MNARSIDQRLDFIEGMLHSLAEGKVTVPFVMNRLWEEIRPHTNEVWKEATERAWEDANQILADMQTDSHAYQKGYADGARQGRLDGATSENDRIRKLVRRELQMELEMMEYTHHDGEQALRQLIRTLERPENDPTLIYDPRKS